MRLQVPDPHIDLEKDIGGMERSPFPRAIQEVSPIITLTKDAFGDLPLFTGDSRSGRTGFFVEQTAHGLASTQADVGDPATLSLSPDYALVMVACSLEANSVSTKKGTISFYDGSYAIPLVMGEIAVLSGVVNRIFFNARQIVLGPTQRIRFNAAVGGGERMTSNVLWYVLRQTDKVPAL